MRRKIIIQKGDKRITAHVPVEWAHWCASYWARMGWHVVVPAWSRA